ncbi:MAG: hypothetical protein ABH871_07675 [Pseudomonadota bacterium]
MGALVNALRATIWSAFTVMTTAALCKCSKDPWIDVKYDALSFDVSGPSLSYPFGYVTNPEVKEMWTNSKMIDSGQAAVKRWWRAELKQPPNNAEIMLRCRTYRNELLKLVGNPNITDGIKIIQTNNMAEMGRSLLLQRYSEIGGNLAIVGVPRRIAKEAKQAVLSKRTIDDYNPWITGALIMLAFGLRLYSSPKRAGEHAEERLNTKQIWARVAAYLLTIGGIIIAVRSADEKVHKHTLPGTDTCNMILNDQDELKAMQERAEEDFIIRAGRKLIE